jgi:tetratricopeptide (TPR) repeat protein
VNERDVTLAHLPEIDRHQRTVDAVQLLAEVFPYEGEDPNSWPWCAQLLTHAQVVLGHARALQLTIPPLGELFTRIGIYLWGRGLDVRLARELHEEALSMRQQLYAGDHSRIADSLTVLALDLRSLGEPTRARELDEQALAMYQRLYDGDNPNVANSLSNLALVLHDLGEAERARELHEQALAMRRRLFEGDHPDVANSLNNLAFDLRRAGEHARGAGVGRAGPGDAPAAGGAAIIPW